MALWSGIPGSGIEISRHQNVFLHQGFGPASPLPMIVLAKFLWIATLGFWEATSWRFRSCNIVSLAFLFSSLKSQKMDCLNQQGSAPSSACRGISSLNA
jgi:hypothetical protein